MPRYKLTIEYDGTRYFGWQLQANQPSVQGALEAAMQAFCGEAVRVHGAGRTDAGVHATGQVAHCNTTREWAAATVRDAVNSKLREAEEQVSVLAVEAVGDHFDARFSAIKRHYTYRIFNRRPHPALLANRVWWVPLELDVDAMREAARELLGKHDFTTFRSTHCQSKSPLKTLDQLDIERDGHEILLKVSARSFLHNQVRSFAGTLKRVGEGGWTAKDVRAALEARDRTACGPVAPPHGLYLTRVDYRQDPISVVPS